MSLERSLHACCSQRSTPRRANNIPAVHPRHFSGHTVCLCYLPAFSPGAEQCPPGSIQAKRADLKLQTLGTWCSQGLCWSLEGGSCCTGPDASLIKKGSCTRVQGYKIWSKQARQPVTGLSCPGQVALCVFAEEQGRETSPASSLVPGEASL